MIEPKVGDIIICDDKGIYEAEIVQIAVSRYASTEGVTAVKVRPLKQSIFNREHWLKVGWVEGIIVQKEDNHA